MSWILVSDRLPEDDVDVLTFVKGRHYPRSMVLDYSREDGLWCDYTGESQNGVLAWQELPSTAELEKQLFKQ